MVLVGISLLDKDVEHLFVCFFSYFGFFFFVGSDYSVSIFELIFYLILVLK